MVAPQQSDRRYVDVAYAAGSCSSARGYGAPLIDVVGSVGRQGGQP